MNARGERDEHDITPDAKILANEALLPHPWFGVDRVTCGTYHVTNLMRIVTV